MRIPCSTLAAIGLALAGVGALAQGESAASPVWQMQDSGTTAGLRGIDSVDGTVAWASGTGGTVLRTVDGGVHWTKCAVPDAATDGATLDFRGVQAWDATTAIVMASGPGDKSRLYKTTDGCKTWTLLFTNPDKDGFWDAFGFYERREGSGHGADGILIGDPIGGKFQIFRSSDQGGTWRRWGGMESDQEGFDKEVQASAKKGEALFAASNGPLSPWSDNLFVFVTGGTAGARLIYADERGFCVELGGTCSMSFFSVRLPMLPSGTSAGAFAMGAKDHTRYFPLKIMVVGGDYTKPMQSHGTSAFLKSKDRATLWFLPQFDVLTPTTPPHGYRSAVQWSESLKLWITVGTNGSDISRDDGKTWQPLDDGNWNALSLPFVVGPNGRIARLNAAALAN